MRMIKKLLHLETKTINSAAVILAASSFVSGLLGLFRDRLLASSFGAGKELDIYYTAFRIPDFISMVLIVGSISAAVIPLFSKHLVKSKEEAFRFFGNLLNAFLFLLVILSIFLITFAPQILKIIAPGFSEEDLGKTVDLTRIMFLSPLLLGISNMISGVLRVFKRFIITSLSPILYNLGIIIGILAFVPFWGLSGLAWGVVLGAFLHFIIQIPILFKLGFSPAKSLRFLDPGVIETVKLTLPRTLGLAATQINLIVITAIGSTLSAGSIAVFNLANNLQGLIVTFIASSFSVAAFPFLSLYFSENNRKKFSEEFSSIFKKILFYIIPASLLMFILRAQIVRIVLGSGRFSWSDTQLTAASLGIFSLGIFAFGLSLLISKTFYALHNTRIPALVAVFSILLNAAFSFLFIWLMKTENIFSREVISFLDLRGVEGVLVLALPLALSISGIIQFILLLFFIDLKCKEIEVKALIRFSFKVILAGVALSVVALTARIFSVGLLDMKTFWGVFLQTLSSAVAGSAAYILFSFFLKIGEVAAIKDFVFSKLPKNKNLSQDY